MIRECGQLRIVKKERYLKPGSALRFIDMVEERTFYFWFGFWVSLLKFAKVLARVRRRLYPDWSGNHRPFG